MKKRGLLVMICTVSLQGMHLEKAVIGFAVGVQATMNAENEGKYSEKKDDTGENKEVEHSTLNPVNASKEKTYFRKNGVQRRREIRPKL